MDIQQGIKLFNNSDFFEAHDHFEEMWNNAGREDRLFYQSLVQLSVGSYHLVSQNYKGALSQYRKGTSKLVEYIPSYQGVNTRKLLKEIRILMKDLNEYFAENICSVKIEKIPKIEVYN